MPKNWGVNSKAEEAREKEKSKKKEKQQLEEEKKESQKWQETDKSALTKLERKKEADQKKEEEAQRKLENKKLYEEEMAAVTSNKKSKTEKLTKAQIKKNQEDALLKSLEKKFAGNKPEGDIDHSDSDDNGLEPNINHIQREKALEDAEKYTQVIDATGLDDALNQLNVDRPDKHPEKRVRAAFEKYIEDQLPLLKQEYPGLKRSQYMEMINKNWKKAPENPFNQNIATYDTKV